MTEAKGTAWFVEKGGKREGPFATEDLRRLLVNGELGPTSLVWQRGMAAWEEMSQVADLRDLLQEIPPPLPASGPNDEAPEPATDDQFRGAVLSAIPRPWVRYFARSVDYILFASALALLFEVLGLSTVNQNKILFTLGCAFLWIPVEAVLLSTWGTTPGKALLNVRLRRGIDAGLSFKEALHRAFRVWWRGAGFGFPIISIGTATVAYYELKREGGTAWDRGHLTVFHRPIGILRPAVVLLIYAAVFGLVASNAGG